MLSDRPHALWRSVLLTFCALTALLAIAELLDVTGAGGQAPWYGLEGQTLGSALSQPFMAEVVSTDPGRAADRAGLRRGDLVDVRANNLVERFAVLTDSGQPMTGNPMHFSVTRGGQHLQYTLIPLPVIVARRLDLIIAPIGVFWLALFASVVAWRRAYVPGNLLLSSVLLLTAIASGVPAHGFAAPWSWVYIALHACTLATPAGIAMWATYASGLAHPLSRTRRVTLATCYALVSVSVAIGVAQNLGIVTLWFDPVSINLHVLWALPTLAATLAALACSVFAIVECRGVERQRAAWSLIPLPFVYLALQGFLIVNFASPSYAFFVGVAYLLSGLTFVAPLALTYAAVNRRLIDIGFVLNRTLVFAIVSAIVIGAFILVEWAVSNWFVSASHINGVIAGMVVALVLGVSMRYIHKYVDGFVDRVFFRKRHEDEAALRKFAHEASYITDRSVLLDRSLQTVREHTDADDVSILVRAEPGSYIEYQDGQTVISENDAAITALRAWGKPVHVNDIAGSRLGGAIAFPMIARGTLVGTIVCGPKITGESFAPDEIDGLMTLAHGVGVSLDSLNSGSSDSIALLHEVLAELRKIKDSNS